eukprot:TRINITY_DN13542_c0_g1_i2.p2 TRINITY_DN13542_c0_g1~~TRINITY_DN13542_c0_g1_i2.p2  ORF type:complete len:316 (-),score=65.95 TRINITY_DN13542_c0_g1_i2:32-946(-)
MVALDSVKDGSVLACPCPKQPRPRIRRPQPRLAELQFLCLDEELWKAQQSLTSVRAHHEVNNASRQASAERKKLLERELQAQLDEENHRWDSAVVIQRQCRGFRVRKFLVPLQVARVQAEDLKRQHAELVEKLQGMRELMHDLTFVEEDRCAAATYIQSWWRGVIGRRFVIILRAHRRLIKVVIAMHDAATRIQSRVRGIAGRREAVKMWVLQEEEETRNLQERKARYLSKIKKIQNGVRIIFAHREIIRRRIARSKALQEEIANNNSDSNETSRRRRKDRKDATPKQGARSGGGKAEKRRQQR